MKFAQTAFFRGIIISMFMLQDQTIGFQTLKNKSSYFFFNISNFNSQVLSSIPFLVTPWFSLFFSVAGFPSKITLSGRLLRLFS